MEITYSISEIHIVAKTILPHLSKIVVFQGDMGMGKTTFIKALVKALGIEDTTGSPSFGLVNQYENASHTVYHFDFYRIVTSEEAFEIGFEEYLYSGNWCFIEWAERVNTYLPEHYTILELEWMGEEKRKVRLKTI